MGKNTSVTLGDHFQEIIDRSIESGRYASASEVIRAGLRMIDEREQKSEFLERLLKLGKEVDMSRIMIRSSI